MNTNSPNEIILYQPDNATEIAVRLENENIWLTQAQIAALFGVQHPPFPSTLEISF